MDESTAAALLNEAQDARMAMRRGEDASAIERFERLYADLRAGMHWQFDQGRAPEGGSFRIGARLVLDGDEAPG